MMHCLRTLLKLLLLIMAHKKQPLACTHEHNYQCDYFLHVHTSCRNLQNTENIGLEKSALLVQLLCMYHYC